MTHHAQQPARWQSALRGHYLQQRIDATVSSNFYTRYIDSLDPMHIMFLQSDIAEFDQWKLTLGEMALKTGDTAPATIIYNRFLQRLRCGRDSSAPMGCWGSRGSTWAMQESTCR